MKENAPVENPETGLVGGCFIAGTQIQTADGTKNIEDIKAGDEVYAYDTETGEKGLKRVLKTFVHNVTELLHVTVNGETIHATPNHPFYVEGVGFKRADELKAGDRVRLLNGEIRKVDKLEPESLKYPVKVFNFKVADWHDYYVGTQGVLVHNADNPCAVSEGRSGYYKDANGRYHRPNGKFASNAEMGIETPIKTSTGTHGNSLSDPRTNYGYALVDKDTNEILKFGETLYPDSRYSQNILDKNNAKMIILEQGSKADIHYWQHDLNMYYKYKYGEFPPLNKGGW